MVRNISSSLMLTAALVSGADSPGWVSKSNQNAQVLLDIGARYYPESAGQYGMSGLDDKIIDLTPKSGERRTRETIRAVKTLRARLDAETDPLVRQDLEILIQAAEQNVHEFQLNEKYYIPYRAVMQTIFGGIQALSTRVRRRCGHR